MQHDNGNNPPASSVPDETPGVWVPTADQPWRPVSDSDTGVLFDYGRHWCADRASHPQFQPDQYPSLNHHRTECRSYDGWFGARSEDGRHGFLSLYLVRPFRFGEVGLTAGEDRLAVEFDPAEDGGELFRCTVPASIIRNLARHLTQTADTADGWRPPRNVEQSMTG